MLFASSCRVCTTHWGGYFSIDCFTVYLHSPNNRQFHLLLVSFCSNTQGDCLLAGWQFCYINNRLVIMTSAHPWSIMKIDDWSVLIMEKADAVLSEIGDPDSKVHGANIGPTWVLSAPDGPHVGPMNLAIRGCLHILLIGHWNFHHILLTSNQDLLESLDVWK